MSLPLLPIWQFDQKIYTAAETNTIATQVGEQFASAMQSAQVTSDNWSNEPLAAALVETASVHCLAQLTATGWWGPSNQLPSTILWKIAGEWLQTGWLQTRAHEKPLGYAGDYALLEAIINETCTSDPLGQIFDRFFLRQAAPAAVRHRTRLVARALATGCLNKKTSRYSVVSVGCGPGLDIRRGIEMLPENFRQTLEVTLLDLDRESLDYAKESLRATMNPAQIHTYRENLSRLARKPQARALFKNPQLLVCTGFFDYLEKNTATELLRFFWDQLPTDGQLLVGNFMPSHPTRAYMEWIGNWYLTYRTPAEMEEMALNAGIPPDCQRIGTEPTGCNLFLQARKA